MIKGHIYASFGIYIYIYVCKYKNNFKILN